MKSKFPNYCASNNSVAAIQPESTTNSLNDGDIIELDSEDEQMPEVGSLDFQSWYSAYLHKLERQYPTAFDLTIKESLSSSDKRNSSNRKQALKMALGYRLQAFDSTTCDIYENLYHHT
ncbi:hypothetical protein DOY81_013036, partial [Sarcophaga bullata]